MNENNKQDATHPSDSGMTPETDRAVSAHLLFYRRPVYGRLGPYCVILPKLTQHHTYGVFSNTLSLSWGPAKYNQGQLSGVGMVNMHASRWPVLPDAEYSVYG